MACLKMNISAVVAVIADLQMHNDLVRRYK